MASSDPAASSTAVAPSAPDSEFTAVVGIATYNERDNLASLVAEIRRAAPQVAILVMDDNSPDGTGALADELAKNDPRIHVVHRSGKLGLGTAILAEMHWAMEHGYGVFVTMDADFSHHPRYLPALLAETSEHDIVIGSRYVPGGGTVNWPWSRQMMSWGVNTLVRTLMRIKARDTSGGFRAYRVDLLRNTNLEGFYSKGYSFQEEMLLRCKLAGARIVESPIIFEDRRLGTTKANLREMVRSMSILVYLGLRTAVGLGPKPKK
jgi:dolichol-phosphate mannosyltransferase